MVHETIRLYRFYCDLSCDMIAEITGIPLSRYKKIELGESEITDEEAEKLAKLYNIGVEELFNGITKMDKFAIRDDLAKNVFMSDETAKNTKLVITQLSPKERKLILLIRSSDKSEENLDEAINMILDK